MSLQEKIYSYLTGEPFWAINRTPNVQTQLYLKDTIGLYYADKALLIYSLFWLGQVFLQYHHHYLWLPHSEFTVQSPLAAWLLAYLLKPIVWYVLFGVVVCANALVFRFSNSIILRLTWALGIILYARRKLWLSRSRESLFLCSPPASYIYFSYQKLE